MPQVLFRVWLCRTISGMSQGKFNSNSASLQQIAGTRLTVAGVTVVVQFVVPHGLAKLPGLWETGHVEETGTASDPRRP
jgi:hypothetical protein